MVGGEAVLSRIYNAYKAMDSETGPNVWNTALLIGWDEPGGTYDHVPPPAVPSPDPASPAGQHGFTFDRSGFGPPPSWSHHGSKLAPCSTRNTATPH